MYSPYFKVRCRTLSFPDLPTWKPSDGTQPWHLQELPQTLQPTCHILLEFSIPLATAIWETKPTTFHSTVMYHHTTHRLGVPFVHSFPPQRLRCYYYWSTHAVWVTKSLRGPGDFPQRSSSISPGQCFRGPDGGELTASWKKLSLRIYLLIFSGIWKMAHMIPFGDPGFRLIEHYDIPYEHLPQLQCHSRNQSFYDSSTWSSCRRDHHEVIQLVIQVFVCGELQTCSLCPTNLGVLACNIYIT